MNSNLSQLAMNKDELTELAANPNLISGIYNYCDRWCERCQFTSKCLLYATEKADPDFDDPETSDITNEKFWRKMHEIFQSTAEMIAEWATEAGVDLNSADSAEAMAEHERGVQAARQDELSQAARRYTDSVAEWFAHEFATEEASHDKYTVGDVAVAEAIEVIRWYQFFIAVKVFRAVSGSDEFDEKDFADEEVVSFDFTADADDDSADIDYDAVLARSSWIDSNGSAKIALVAIDRSMAAWRVMEISLPEKSDKTKPMLIELERLRRAIEARFPRARDFIRPGFDESVSEFVS